MARGVKRLAELLLVRSGAARAWGRLAGSSAVVLAYHNVVPDGERAVGDLSLHLDRRDFAAQLDRLVETHEVVHLPELASRHDAASRRPLAAITFDDAYVGALTAGLEELEARGLPATVFVCPGRLGAAGFWWDVLAGPDGLPGDLRDVAIHRLRGEQERVLDHAVRSGVSERPLPDHARPIDEAGLLATLSASSVLAMGSHSWSHPNLAALGADEVDDELRRARAWLDAHAAAAAGWLAYPYGLTSDVVASVAERHAEGALRVDGGPVGWRGRWAASPYALPRVNVPRGLSVEGLALRLAGALGR